MYIAYALFERILVQYTSHHLYQHWLKKSSLSRALMNSKLKGNETGKGTLHCLKINTHQNNMLSPLGA